MPTFSYKAIDQKGKEKTGKVEATSQDDANAKIQAMGLIPTSVTQERDRATKKSATPTVGSSGKKKALSFGKVLNQEELTIFTRQLATLLQAGLPLLRSLEVLIRQEKNPRFREILVQLGDNVRTGNTLSDGLQQHPKVFDSLYVNMVRAGEAGGVLDVVLSRLALFMEKTVKIKKKVKAAMIYPIIVVSVAVLIVGLLMTFVVPKFQEIFNSILKGQRLPPLTEFVIGISNFIKSNVILTIIIFIALFVAFRFFKSTKGGKQFLDKVALKTPKLGELVSKVAVSRFARTFGTLLSSGVPILQALSITRDVVGNSQISNALDQVHDRVRDGETVAGPLEKTKVFPSMVTSMIDVGEETGELPAMLNRVADNYDEEVDNAVAGITSIIEPIMIVFLAVVVGVIVIALFLPIVSIIQNL